MDVGTVIQQLGVSAAIVAFAVWVILDMRQQRTEDRAIIASKDKTILEMLPVLENANIRMADVTSASTELSKVATELITAKAIAEDRAREGRR